MNFVYRISIDKSKLLNSIYNETDIGQSGYFYAIVDATTGKDIEDDNDVDVTCTSSDWKYAYYPKYHFSSEGYDYWYRAVKKVRISATVVYPEDYEDLGIIIGMYDSAKCKDGKNENAFWSGTKSRHLKVSAFSYKHSNHTPDPSILHTIP